MPQSLAMPGSIAQPGATTRWLTTFLHVPLPEIEGCTPEEVAEIEAAAGQPLPLAYRQWLVEAGRKVGPPRIQSQFQRAFMLYPEVLEVREIVAEIIAETGGDRSLLDRAIPFFNWDIYHICLLDMSPPREDPPILRFDDHTGRARLSLGSFSQFISWQIFQLADGIAMTAREQRLDESPSSG